MRLMQNRFVRVGALALALSAPLVASACGGDDDDEADVGQVQITASGTPNQPSFELDQTAVDSGATELTLVNETNGPADGQLAFVPAGEERSDEEVVGQLRNAFQGRPVDDWFQGGGGPGRIGPGESSTVTQDLQPGTYYVLAAEDLPQPPLTKFEVSEGDGAELPETEGEVSAVDYSFSGEGLQAGNNQILLANDGAQWHHFLASKLKEGGTIEQARTFLETEGRGGAPNPFEGSIDETAVESTILEGGVSQIVDAELEPGNYAFFCFISDKQGGPPHIAKGMVSEVTVEE